MEAKPKLLDRVRDKIRTKHYSYRTEQQYVGWIRRYIRFHGTIVALLSCPLRTSSGFSHTWPSRKR